MGLYIASSGKQSAMLGFFPLDEGDAPESYGKAQHSIGTVDGVTGTKLAQPYLGTVGLIWMKITQMTGQVMITLFLLLMKVLIKSCT